MKAGVKHVGLLAALIGSFAGALPQVAASMERVSGTSAPQQQKKLREHFGGGSYTGAPGRRKGPGWTQAQVQRMARKRRNVLRHRAACRGRK